MADDRGTKLARTFVNRLALVREQSLANKGPKGCLGSLHQFANVDVMGSLADYLEYDEDDTEKTDTEEKMSHTLSSSSFGRTFKAASPVTSGGASSKAPQPPASPKPTLGPRRRTERVGNKLMRIRLDSPRHEQLSALVPLLPGSPKLTAEAQEAYDLEQLHLEEQERLALEAELASRKKKRRSTAQARNRFKAAGLVVMKFVGDREDKMIDKNEKNLEEEQKKEQERVAELEKIARRTGQRDPWHFHLKEAMRPEVTPRGDRAQRDALALQGNFNPGFVADIVVKPRVDAQPILTFMEQGDIVFADEEENASEQALLARRLQGLRYNEPRRGPWAARPEATKSSAEDGHGPRTAAPKKAAATFVVNSRDQELKPDLHRIIELMDPDRKVGSIDADMIVPLMFWLGLTKHRSAALATVEAAFGSRDIEDKAMALMSEHVEVQLSLVEGLRYLARRESLDQLCEYLTDNNCHRIRTWFGSMKSDPFGCVDITQVQSMFLRMELTTNRQTLFRFLSYMADHPPPDAAADPREQIAIENRKFSLKGFVSLIGRCCTAWCLHRTMSMLTTEMNSEPASSVSSHELSCRWIQLQRKITISLLVNQRFWGRESRNVLQALMPPQIDVPELAEVKDLSLEQWNLLFQRVRAQGLASVLLSEGEEAEKPGEQQMPPSDSRKGTRAGRD
mmetsp:Transcript_52535/g.94254  ORF Transcript_52535/g.94254 Transcript_52535/m.94254 type:complete len:680 (-) Transcript_52535:34-2073(-)